AVATANPGMLIARLPDLLGRACLAALSAEDLGPDGRPLVALSITALALVALATAGRDAAARRRVRAVLPLVLAAAAWFVAGAIPLAALLPDWNAWRAWTPTLGFDVAAGAALGAVSPWLAGGLAVIKLSGLLMAP